MGHASSPGTGTPLPRLVISAPHRSSGKSTVSVGLCAALRALGLAVQPFKKGPDFIDPMWLSAASGRSCRTLDFFMMGRDRIRQVFAERSSGADLSLVECNHGLHDGLDLEGGDSSAALAVHLDAPVVLVVNAARMGRGIVPLVLGQVGFDRSVRVAGLILNRVGSGRHEKKIREALERYCDVPVLGTIPYRAEVEIAERHLGLTPLQEAPGLASRIEELGRSAARYLDLEGIIEAAKKAPPAEALPPRPEPRREGATVRIGIATDRAFNFYYPENLEALEAAGAELVPFSPLSDPFPPETDGLYIGGGFPEFFMEELEGNVSMRSSLREAIDGGLPAWAECGGLMYLSRGIHWRGKSCGMVGALPCEVDLSERPAGHGYVLLEESGSGPWPQGGRTLKGHEFHHSRIRGLEKGAQFAFRALRGSGTGDGRDGLIHRNCLATYTHLHTDGAPFWAGDVVSFLRSCRKPGP